MYELTELFRPLTASPFLNAGHYCEIPPCAPLKPYIRCFWGTAFPVNGKNFVSQSTLVIPDGCMDVIFRADYDKGNVKAVFCGLDEEGSFGGSAVTSGGLTATFGVRFYLWAASMFTQESLAGTRGGAVAAEMLFPQLFRDISAVLSRGHSLAANAQAAEQILLRQLTKTPDSDLMNALHIMLKNSGRMSLTDLSMHTGCTRKRIERLFRENTGAAPKAVMSVLRYQLLWQELISASGINVLDAVEKYGYYDQPHLLNDFRRRHLMTPQAALRHARNAAVAHTADEK